MALLLTKTTFRTQARILTSMCTVYVCIYTYCVLYIYYIFDTRCISLTLWCTKGIRPRTLASPGPQRPGRPPIPNRAGRPAHALTVSPLAITMRAAPLSGPCRCGRSHAPLQAAPGSLFVLSWCDDFISCILDGQLGLHPICMHAALYIHVCILYIHEVGQF